MPNWVRDEAKWGKAKEAALKSYKESDPKFYAVVTEIYKNMGGKIGAATPSAILGARVTPSTILATGTSFGAWKGWHEKERREWTGKDYSDYAESKSAEAEKEGTAPTHNAAAVAHKEAAEFHTKFSAKEIGAIAKAAVHVKKAAEHAAKSVGKVAASINSEQDYIRARAALDIVTCRCAVSPVSVTADSQWELNKPVSFMYMPAGKHTIVAGFRGKAIQLTVNVDPRKSAGVLQASLDQFHSTLPKQAPFGCVEHEEKDASVWAKAFEAKEDGVYLAAEPSELGVRHVNGRIHRSWSPSFFTDADYASSQLDGDCYVFPEGVRGSESNPAEITGCGFCVGTLTNKPAFREMSPVKAREMAASFGVKAEDATVPTALDMSAMLALLNDLRVAHWNADTKSEQHEALGEIYDSLDELADRFAEAYMGAKSAKVAGASFSDTQLMERGAAICSALCGSLNKETDSALCNIVDEMKESVDKARYLLKAKDSSSGSGGTAITPAVK